MADAREDVIVHARKCNSRAADLPLPDGDEDRAIQDLAKQFPIVYVVTAPSVLITVNRAWRNCTRAPACSLA